MMVASKHMFLYGGRGYGAMGKRGRWGFRNQYKYNVAR
jgi:hypothetical protein